MSISDINSILYLSSCDDATILLIAMPSCDINISLQHPYITLPIWRYCTCIWPSGRYRWYAITRPYAEFHHPERMAPDQTVRILVEAMRVLTMSNLDHLHACRGCIVQYSGCRDHEGSSRGHEGACSMAILSMRRLYNVYSTWIVAVENMRALVEAMMEPTVWQLECKIETTSNVSRGRLGHYRYHKDLVEAMRGCSMVILRVTRKKPLACQQRPYRSL